MTTRNPATTADYATTVSPTPGTAPAKSLAVLRIAFGGAG